MLDTLLQLAVTLAMVVIYAVVFVLVYAKVMGGMFSRAKFRPLVGDTGVRFADVLGIDEAKREAKEVVDFLRHADAFERMGAHVPRGVLLVGPPGTGKTMLAKAIAREAGVPFYALSGSDFVEVFVGVGASRIRALYRKARKHPAAIVFIDELDALGRTRTSGPGGNQEGNNTLNQLLVELDGMSRGGNVITIAATNLEETLDAALMRPGRFDRKIHVGLPDLAGREALLRHYAAQVKVEPGVDLRALARASIQMSGADLAQIVNEASILAVRAHRLAVKQEDFTRAIERLGLGLESSRTLMDGEREVVAVHEAGHAVISRHLAPTKRLHKISILPTGRHALGYTWSVQLEERHLTTCDEYLGELAVLMGGRVAEEQVFGRITSGAHGDLRTATRIAEALVWELGMSGGTPANYRDRPLAEATRERLDQEVERLLRDALEQARDALQEHRGELDQLTRALLEHEVLYQEDVEAVLRGEAPAREPRDPEKWVR